jgi:hypothetical protein
MAWIDSTALAKAVRSVLGMGPNELLAQHWTEPIDAAIETAKGIIRSALADRGFLPPQIESWDDLASYHRRVAICTVFREGGIGKAYDSLHLGEYCKAVGQLATVRVTIGGIVVKPTGTTGTSSFGEYDDSDSRIAQMSD